MVASCVTADYQAEGHAKVKGTLVDDVDIGEFFTHGWNVQDDDKHKEVTQHSYDADRYIQVEPNPVYFGCSHEGLIL